MTKKEWVKQAFDNQIVDRVPMGFWFHFLPNEATANIFENPELLEETLAGHKRYIEEFKPDFMKIMSDGYFQFPLTNGKKRISCLDDLQYIDHVDESHPWVKAQVSLAQQIAAMDPDLLYLYNTFAPSSSLKFSMWETGTTVMDLLEEDAEAVGAALDLIGDGLAALAKSVITAANLDGIYMSVGNPDIERCSDEMYRKYITPSEKKVLDAANEVSDYSMMHICGWGGCRNNLNLYKDYNPKVFNWATHVENIGLKEGKEILGGKKAVLGGFPSEEGSFLYKGSSKEEIQDYTRKLIQDNGKKGIMIGADCTLPMDINWEHLEWVRDALKEMS